MSIPRADAAQLLRRAGYGGTRSEIDALASLNLATAVESVLNVSAAPPAIPPPEVGNPAVDSYLQFVALHTWWVERMRLSTTPLHEKMTQFWHGHFASSLDKVGIVSNMLDQNQLFRSQGLGSFRTLCQSVAASPAMIRYLDNDQNVVGAPNENFARELMELFTLGVNQYTQADVVASAAAWTGYGTDQTGTRAFFDAANHENSLKRFFGITQNWNGPQIIDQMLMGSSKATAARFIANKLWSYLAYPRPPQVVSDAITNAFLVSNDLDVTALLRAIFNRPEFYSPQAKSGLVRTPTEFVVAALRSTGISASVARPDWYTDGMGQQLFNPPNVAGWPQNGYWISASAFWSRAGFARNLTWSAVNANMLASTPSLPVAGAVQTAFDAFGIDAPSAFTRSSLENWLTGERAAGGGAEQANLITLTMLTPEFQLA